MILRSHLVKHRLVKTKVCWYLAATVGLIAPHIASASNYKHSAVPAQEINKQALPDLLSGSINSHSTMLPLTNSDDDLKLTKQQSWSQKVIIDSNEQSAIVILSPQADRLNLKVTAPDGSVYLSETGLTGQKLAIEKIALGNQSFSGKRLSLPDSSIGTWTVSMQPVKGDVFDKKPTGYILVKGDPAYQLITHLDNKFTTQNSNTHMVAYVVSPNESELTRRQLKQQKSLTGVIHKAHAKITWPNGQMTNISLNDQGEKGDKVAGDGKFTGPLPTKLTGTYSTEVYVEGVRQDGLSFSRSTADLYPVETQSFEFANQTANLKLLGGTRTAIQIPVLKLTNTHQEIYAAAEVWGTNHKGRRVAATWVGGIVKPNTTETATLLELGFDYRWLSQARLNAPYELRDLRLQTVETNTPIAQFKQLPLQVARGILPKPDNGLTNRYSQHDRSLVSESALKAQPYLTNDMLMGPAPGSKALAALSLKEKSAKGGKLMLVHGYCSSDVWDSSHFTNDIKFKDFKKSRSHNNFALRLAYLGNAYPSFGVVAHSQGGAAALHLYSKYFSKLDFASGGRRIQSVGTPYQGTALAGNLAILGRVFGFGCGKNTDLTYNGSANWLSTIPYWARSQVNYYTTSFTKKWWRPDWCHIATDFVLSDPEDGTTEKWSGQLAGGNNRGHKIGWCHSRGMRDSAQSLDRGRNNEMNRRAAR